jgi:hypothetical protein
VLWLSEITSHGERLSLRFCGETLSRVSTHLRDQSLAWHRIVPHIRLLISVLGKLSNSAAYSLVYLAKGKLSNSAAYLLVYLAKGNLSNSAAYSLVNFRAGQHR